MDIIYNNKKEKKKRKQIEKEFGKEKLIIILEHVARLCKRWSITNSYSNYIFVGEGNFTEYCQHLYDESNDYIIVSKYLIEWKDELMKLL